MDIVSLSKVSGLPLRRLRYVLEHGVLPGAAKASRGRRIPRSFTGFESFSIAVAAVLMEGGQRRSSVADCIGILTVEPSPHPARVECPLFHAYLSSGEARLEVGDGVNVRVRGVRGNKHFDTGWLQAATGVSLTKSYVPFVMMSIDVTRLSGPIRKAANE
jgi:hypothetical protein